MKVSTDDGRVVLTTKEYDILVNQFPDWMQSVWVKLPKNWYIYAVVVFGCAGSGLAERLNTLRS